MTGVDLARAAGLSQPFYSRLESGNVGASDDTIHRLAEALKVSVPAIVCDPEAA